jgi:type VI secretion system protein ImpG
MNSPNDDFLLRYMEELSYLRQMGQRYAKVHPKIAGRLELGPDECPDPHVERLLEGFAFLTARIQTDLDADFPEIAAELLNVLYPHYLNPVPSLSIARFEFDRERGKITTGVRIPRDTKVFATPEQDEGRQVVCRMMTCYPVTLWPIEVVEASLESSDAFDFIDSAARVLRVRLKSHADAFEEMGVDELRFYLHGSQGLAGMLYELLVHSTNRVMVAAPNARTARTLPHDAVRPVGFGRDEHILPYPSVSHPAYRLLQEYFVFPDKFHFVDICGLRGKAIGQEVDLLFVLDRAPRGRIPLRPETFSLGCTPIVNLYSKTSEPIRVDHRQFEYRLVPDMRRERHTEVHSIKSVSGTSNPLDRTRDYAPFYSYTHAMRRGNQRAFYHARRVRAQNPELTGTDVLLSFRNSAFKPERPADEIVFAQVLCTNRGLALQIPADAILQCDEAMPARIVCVDKPTAPIDPPLGGENLWRIVSHLSLNYLSLDETEDSLKALHAILRLYSFLDTPRQRRQIEGIRELSHRHVVRRVGSEAWRGFVRGTEVSLLFDEDAYVGSSAFLMASVLNHFFALYASTNSFTQLVARRVGLEDEEWQRWPPMAGGRAVL